MYEVRLSPQAKQFYRKADKPLAQKLARCFEQLEQTPRDHPNAKPLKGNLAGQFRYRVGDYRVIYRVEEQQVLVMVLKIAHRGRSYD